MVELQALSKKQEKSPFIGCGRVEESFSYHDIVTVADKETGQSLGKDVSNLVSQPRRYAPFSKTKGSLDSP